MLLRACKRQVFAEIIESYSRFFFRSHGSYYTFNRLVTITRDFQQTFACFVFVISGALCLTPFSLAHRHPAVPAYRRVRALKHKIRPEHPRRKCALKHRQRMPPEHTPRADAFESGSALSRRLRAPEHVCIVTRPPFAHTTWALMREGR